MKASDFAGTVTLFRLFLRRDRFLLPLWIFLPVILALITAATFTAMAGQGLERVLTEFDNDSLISALLGPVMSFDLSGAIVWRGVSQLALVLGIGSLLTVIRHTRTDEETGRSELIRAYVVGPYASLTAALMLTGMGNLAAGLLIALSIIALGGGAGGSFLFGATLSVMGCFFAGIGAFGVQLRENSGTARGIGITALGLGMGMAILNNFGGGATLLKWITPMAWQRLTQPFAANLSWSLLYCDAFAAVPILFAYVLSARRDLGAGVLSARSGPPEAAPRLSNPLALAWQLHKRSFIGWLAGTGLYIAVFAAISPGLSKTGGMSDWLSNLGGTSWSDAVGLGYVFISIAIYLISLFVAVYAMTAVLRLKKEENEGRAEMLVDKQVSRMGWMSSHLIAAAFCSAALLLAVGIAGGLIFGLAAGDLSDGFWPIFVMSVSKIPPVWILLGVTALLYGLWPRMTALGWVVWLSFAMVELAWEGRIIDWSLMRISPFSYVHYTIDVTNLPLLPLFLLLCLSALLTGIGLFGFRHRDVLTKA
ncbi:ABC transporter permease [Candidatus Formimonas warabiya]|uniref:ABC transporter permease n=1 Tax=Formimonas warabiya TaxID=1761012 RepID=A0A3G1KYN5_FORW1|nr:hypothetical protein [Candidatus Formimonas warabiya]ATW27469.1 hypothetical protein DCMF_24375 [Candidatus Formimonas warabiya]